MELRQLRDSDMERFWDLDAEAFHVPSEKREAFLRWKEPSDYTGLFDGDRLVAVSGAFRFGQFFGGRSVPMGGLTSVSVAPDRRGEGAATQVCRRSLELMRERGDAISTLFPAATLLYRSLGWEAAGASAWRSIVPRHLKDLPRPTGGRVRRARPEDAEAIRACYAVFARPVNGCIDRPEHRWQYLEDEWKQRTVFVAENAAGALEGYLVYRQVDGEYSAFGGDFQLFVDDAVATTRDASLLLWRLIGSWSSQVSRVIYRSSAEDPLVFLLPNQDMATLGEVRWMTRVLDPVAAVASRGFPGGLGAEVHLALDDPLFEESAGRFVLTLQKGEGRLERGGDGSVRLDVGAFSALYTGYAPSAQLARAGRLVGGSEDARAALDSAFAGPTPRMLDEF